MTIDSVTAAHAAGQDTQRATLALAKALRLERETAQATLALIEQAAAPATGRLIDVRA
jgi:hypothetical protein